MGQITTGGTVLNVSGDGTGLLWLATPAGLYQGQADQWQAVVAGVPFTHVNAVLAIGRSIFAAGLNPNEHGLVRSYDNGHSWQYCWIDQVEAPITSLVASPNYGRDRVLLAGTHGDGVLRSTDGGRYWHLSNFGLRDFAILSLAVAPAWDRREIAFAATEDGVYRSPNGGRAWKRSDAGIEGVEVVTLLVGANGVAYAGSEGDGLFYLEDKGHSWQAVSLAETTSPLINCLCQMSLENGAPVFLMGTGEHGILRSQDGGKRWQNVASHLPPVLSITAVGDQLYATLDAEGLLVSEDTGLTWKKVAGLSAHRFNWLAAPAPDWLVVAGPEEGVWLSQDDGERWQPAFGWPEETHIFTFTAVMGAKLPIMIVATPDSVLQSVDAGANWIPVLTPADGLQGAALALAFSPTYANDCIAWLGSSLGQLWVTVDAGQSWELLETPWHDLPVMALAASPEFATDQTLVVITMNQRHREAQLWRSMDGGQQWSLWLTERFDRSAAQIAPAGKNLDQVALGLGTTYLQSTPSGWQRSIIAEEIAPITSLIAIPGSSERLAATLVDVLFTKDGQHWQGYGQGLERVALADLALTTKFNDDQQLLLLTVDGQIWCRKPGSVDIS